MGGAIEMESRPGEGSTFRFTVRFERRPEAERPAARRSAVRLAGRRVLVVDDNATNREILRQQLRHWGLRVSTVADGAGALLSAARGGGEGLRLRAGGARHEDAGHGRAHPRPRGQGDARHRRGQDPAAHVLRPPRPRRRGRAHRRLGLPHEAGRRGRPARLPGGGARRATEHRAASSSPGTRCARRARSASATVLVAEDNEVNQKVAARLLERLGYRVEVADDGAAALAACARRRYDAVLMDSQMPQMDGFEATRRIRELEQGTDAPHADHRHDRERDEGRPRALPGGRHGRLRGQAGDARRRCRRRCSAGSPPRTRDRGSAPEPRRRRARAPVLDESVVQALMAHRRRRLAARRAVGGLPAHRRRAHRRDAQGGRAASPSRSSARPTASSGPAATSAAAAWPSCARSSSAWPGRAAARARRRWSRRSNASTPLCRPLVQALPARHPARAGPGRRAEARCVICCVPSWRRCSACSSPTTASARRRFPATGPAVDRREPPLVSRPRSCSRCSCSGRSASWPGTPSSGSRCSAR